MNLIVDNPNFSIITPAPCNASCDFCFWNRDYVEVDPRQYLTDLVKVLDDLPDDFQQCSITGGEPTMLPWLRGIMVLVRERFDKVVFTTNGWNLEEHLYLADEGLVDHVNISRHAIGIAENMKVFGTKNVALDGDIKQLSSYFQRHGIDVTINCVLPETFKDVKFIFNFIEYVKELNGNAVAFRKDHSDLFDMGVEPFMGNIIETSGCPACKNDFRLVNGMLTYWKYSVSEPSNELGGVYELVYHQNGVLSSDWKGEQVINL